MCLLTRWSAQQSAETLFRDLSEDTSQGVGPESDQRLSNIAKFLWKDQAECWSDTGRRKAVLNEYRGGDADMKRHLTGLLAAEIEMESTGFSFDEDTIQTVRRGVEAGTATGRKHVNVEHKTAEEIKAILRNGGSKTRRGKQKGARR